MSAPPPYNPNAYPSYPQQNYGGAPGYGYPQQQQPYYGGGGGYPGQPQPQVV